MSEADLAETAARDYQPETEGEDKREEGPDAKWRMELTEEEREWALEIKAAAATVPELDPFSDFFYVQMAILTLSDPDEMNLELVVDRMLHYQQYFRDGKKIQDNYETACKTLDKTMLELVPGHFLSYTYDRKEDSYVLVIDPPTFDRATTNDLRKFDYMLASTYFVMQAQSHDFEAMRSGVIVIYEGGGYDWRNPDMYNIDCVKRQAELAHAYPLLPRSFRFYNTSMFGNLLLSACKRFMPVDVCKAFDLGWDCGGQKLRDILLVPDLETATHRTLGNIKDALKKRYANEKNFSLVD